jgi:hypothetical protein
MVRKLYASLKTTKETLTNLMGSVQNVVEDQFYSIGDQEEQLIKQQCIFQSKGQSLRSTITKTLGSVSINEI